MEVQRDSNSIVRTPTVRWKQRAMEYAAFTGAWQASFYGVQRPAFRLRSLSMVRVQASILLKHDKE